ncbi:MAG: class I SAM-dependent methyltransferase [Elusimicrobia bacterium]|nr:class I SAM-dependent methyltransferase [Elusimicrobiota bacterium]
MATQAYYQKIYQEHKEPWNYRARGAEILRHEEIPDLLFGFKGTFENVLDIGTSLGQLTRKLLPLSKRLVGFDVSSLAVKTASLNCPMSHAKFLVAALPGLPFLQETFDLIVVSDGIHEFVLKEKRKKALAEIHMSLKKDGICLFSDYLKTKDYNRFLELIESSHFKIVFIYPLYDRVWYQFESWFKGIRNFFWVKKLISSITIVKILRMPARLLGKYGSRHILILAQKKD